MNRIASAEALASSLSPYQKQVLSALTQLQLAFVLAYAGEGQQNATQSAIIAGYAEKSAAVTACRMLKLPKIQTAIQALMPMTTPVEALPDPIMDEVATDAVTRIEQIREFWWNVACGKVKEPTVLQSGEVIRVAPKLKDRLRAAELLGKSIGAFVERHEHDVKHGGGVVFGTISEAESWAREALPSPVLELEASSEEE